MCATRASCSPARERKKGRPWTQANEIRLAWSLRWPTAVFIATVLLTAFTLCEKTNGAGGCGTCVTLYTDSSCVCSVNVNMAKLNDLFLMWSVAIRFQTATKWTSKRKQRFVLIIYTKGLLLQLFLLKSSAVFISWLLMACGDIESNPGPTQQNIQEPSRDVYSNYSPSYGHIPVYPGNFPEPNPGPDGNPNHRLFCMAGYQHDEDRYITGKLQGWWELLQKDNEHLKQKIDHLTNKCHLLEQQCETLFQWKDLFLEVSQKMDNQVDRVESFSRRNNLRFFNVFENPNETSLQCTRKVVQLMNRFFSSKQWTVDDVERVHRVGQRNSNNRYPRPIIACFSHWQDKMSILRSQECRKEMADALGIRVAADLTNRQNQIVREERNAGRHAYFWRGRLFYSKNKRNDSRKRDLESHSGAPSYGTAAPQMHSKSSHSDHSREMHEPVNQHDVVQNDEVQCDVDKHLTLADIPYPQNSTDDLPWTADMTTFPPLPDRRAEDMKNCPQTSDWIDDSHHRKVNQQRRTPRSAHHPTTLKESTVSGERPKTSAAALPSNPSRPQRTPRARDRLTINQWGARLLSSPERMQASQPPSSYAGSGAASSPTAPESLLEPIQDSWTLHKSVSDAMAVSNKHRSSPEDKPEPTLHGVPFSSTPFHTRQTTSSDPDADPPAHMSEPAVRGVPFSNTHPHTGQAMSGDPGANSVSHLSPPSAPDTSTLPETTATSSQTLVKQLNDPWTDADMMESQSPVNIIAESEDQEGNSPAHHVTFRPDEQKYSMTTETPKSHIRLTRSKAKCRQQHVTECFPRIGTGSSRPDVNDQLQNT